MKNSCLVLLLVLGSVSSLHAGDLRRAAASGSLKRVQKVLENLESDTDEHDQDFQPAFFLAVQKGFVDIVRELLRHGADMNTPDAKGKTAIFLANQEKQIEVMKIIRQRSI